MIRTNAIITVMLTGILILMQMLTGAAAATPARSLSLEENIGSSTAIVVARLTSFTTNTIQPVDPIQPRRAGFEGSAGSQQDFIARQAKRPPGVDKFTIVARLKGQCPDELEVQSPAVIWMFYGNRDLLIPENEFYLLFLTSDKDGHWTPTDETLPLIPLGPKVDAPARRPATEQVDPYDSVVRYLTSSLVDPQIAVSSSYFLRKVQGDAVVAAMRPLANDPNTYTQDHALYCLALNQVVSVIPQIAALEAEHRAANGGTEAVIGLALYGTPEAVPYLNELLIDARSPSTRLNAATALIQIGDPRSIPFWIMALRDPQQRGLVAFRAYFQLHRLVPSLGVAKDRNYFDEHRQEEIVIAEKWWADESAKSARNTPAASQP